LHFCSKLGTVCRISVANVVERDVPDTRAPRRRCRLMIRLRPSLGVLSGQRLFGNLRCESRDSCATESCPDARKISLTFSLSRKVSLTFSLAREISLTFSLSLRRLVSHSLCIVYHLISSTLRATTV